MRGEYATGEGQADLTLEFNHHKDGVKGGFKLKDFQVASAEFIGTFYLCFVIAMTGPGNNLSAYAPYAIGFALTSAVYMTGPISGGMVNPAVTLALVTRNKLNLFEATYCIIFQLMGAFVAGAVAYGIYGSDWSQIGYPAISDSSRRGQAFISEAIQTFGLCTVVLNTATTKAQQNNSYFGVAIGFVVLSGALTIGGMSGGSFNPAVSMLALYQHDWNDLWAIVLGPLVGGLIAGLVFRVTNPSEWDDTDPLAQFPLAQLTFGSHNPEGNLTRLAAMLSQEFIGTFFWSWAWALGVNTGPLNAVFAYGTIVTAMVYAGGAISGAHYNPAVTFGVYLRGLTESPPLMRGVDCIQYMAVQIAAAFTGAALAAYCTPTFPNISYPVFNHESFTPFSAVAADFIMAFGYVLIILVGGTMKKNRGNSYFGLAIGFFLISQGIVTQNIAGGSVNPAIAIALCAINQAQLINLWIWVVGPFAGALAAAGVFTLWYYNTDDAEPEPTNFGVEAVSPGRASELSMARPSQTRANTNVNGMKVALVTDRFDAF